LRRRRGVGRQSREQVVVAEGGCGIASAAASGAGGRGHRSGRGWLLLVGHLLLAIDEGDGLLLDGSCCRLNWR